MRKGITLLTVLLLPITIYLIFAISTIHYIPVPHYGPRTARIITDDKGQPKKDTVYHTIASFAFPASESQGLLSSDVLRGHMYLAAFVQKDSSKNHYNCNALSSYYLVNKGELDTLHFVFFTLRDADSLKPLPNFADSLKLKHDHSYTFSITSKDLDFLQQDNYFKKRTADEKQSWKTLADLVLIDSKGCIRGYYDGNLAPEMTRMVEDIKHIKFHDEAAGMEKKYTPHKKGY